MMGRTWNACLSKAKASFSVRASRLFRGLILGSSLGCTAAVVYADAGTAKQQLYPNPLPVESIPNVESLPSVYPKTWIFAHDLNFNTLLDGKLIIVDLLADESKEIKGIFGAGMMGQFQPASTNSELYTAQTFYTRRTYGERSDVIIVFDKSTLLPVSEIALPPKRQQIVTQPNSFQLIDDDRMGLVMNFTPAASVTLVNLEKRSVLSEVAIPGCNFIFPTGRRGFSTLCADGGLITYRLNEDGTVASSEKIPSFIDIQADPLFVKNATVHGVTFFPSYQGRMQPIDFRSDTPTIDSDWSMIPNDLKRENWRPSGWQVIAASKDEIFVIMQKDGKEGSHKAGGTEVWVFDPDQKTLNRRLPLRTSGLSLVVAASDPAYLVVTNTNMDLDVYTIDDNRYLKTINLGIAAFPFTLYPN